MKQFKKILCVLNPTNDCKSTLERAISLAENNQARLTVVQVIPESSSNFRMQKAIPETEEWQQKIKAQHLLALQLYLEPYQERLHIQQQVLTGTVFLEIIRAVLREEYDLVIKLAENPGYLKRIFGSDDMHLLRKCPCPVWLTKGQEKSNYDQIVAAIDFDTDLLETRKENINQQILEISSTLALSDFASLHFVHVWDAPGELTLKSWSGDSQAAVSSYINAEKLQHQKCMDLFQESLQQFIGADISDQIEIRSHLLRGSAVEVIPEFSKKLDADLLVMGTVARTGISGLFMGNTAEAILEQLQCSVLAIKPPGFKTPVRLSEG
jgi:universal stress protein E